MATEKALELAEQFLRQRLIAQEHVIDLPMSDSWQRLPERPVLTIGGDLSLAIDIDSIGDGWVRTKHRSAKVRYTAGMASTEDGLPEPIKVALVDLDQHLEGGGSPEHLPPRVVALLQPYQRRVAIEASEAETLAAIR